MTNQKIKIIEGLVEDGFMDVGKREYALEMLDVEPEASSPWYVQLLIGTGAWISATLFGVFFATTGIVDSEESALVVGAILLTVTLWVSIQSKVEKIAVFPEQLLLSASFAGHFLLIFGIAGVFNHYEIVGAIIVVLVSIAFLIYYSGKIHKIASTWLILSGLGYILYELNLPAMTVAAVMVIGIAGLSAWMWLNEVDFLIGGRRQIGRPVQYAVIIAFLFVGGIIEHSPSLFYWGRRSSSNLISWHFSYAEIVTTGLFFILSYVILKILQRLNIEWKSTTAVVLIIFTGILSVAFYRSPAILASLLVLMLGIERGNKLLVPIAIVSLIYFYSSYYYRLDITLMDKSLILMGSGTAMLVAGFFLNRGGRHA